MPKQLGSDHSYSPAAPTDLRWKDHVKVDVEAAEIMTSAARRTIVRFAGDQASTILGIVFGTEQQ